ncbi:minor tail protein [Mycobacterium phage Sheila]|nr:minor tail protein [Mycobacterium phage Sheila]
MGVYIGNTPISKIMAGASPNAGKVYIGSTQVWPEVEFPLVYEDVNLTDALVPAGATALVIEQLVGGGASGLAGQNQSGAGTYTNRGGTGGGGGAVIGQHIIPISELGPTFSLQIGAGGEQSTSDTTRNNGGPTIFSSGSIVLTAGGGTANGGVASQSGQWYVPMANGTAGGVNNTMGGAAGGAEGVSYSHSGNPQNDNEKWDALSADPAGTAMQVLPGGLKPGNGGSQSGTGQRPGGGGGGGKGRSSSSRGGGGGGGKGRSSSSRGVGGRGGDGYARIYFINTSYKRDITRVYTTAGAWTWTPPPWAVAGTKIDIVMFPGGRAGKNGATFGGAGRGGLAGTPVTATLTVGTDIPVSGALTGVVGAGGASNGAAGGVSTCTTVGLTAPVNNADASGQDGGNAPNVTLNGITYPGGRGGSSGTSSSAGEDGQDPGGGGEGGGSLIVGLAGGAGGKGRVYVRVYEV